MAKIKLNGDTSGYIEISAPAVSGNNTLELGPGTKILTNLDNTFTGVSTFSSDVYFGNDIYLKDGIGGYEKVEVGANDIRVESKHIHSEFGVWTRSNSLSDRRNGIDGDNNDLRLYANSAERLRITSAGDMGLGTATPTSFGPTFQIAGTDPALLLQDTATAVDYFGINVQSGAVVNWFDDSAYFAIGTASGISGGAYSEKVRITSDGKFGINTTSPGKLLSVSGGTDDDSFIRMNNEEVGLYFGAWGTGSSYPRETTINGTRFDNGSAPFLRIGGQGGIKFCVDLNSERMRITSGGDVLIGGQTAYTYDDTGASNTILDITNSTNNKRGILSLSGNSNADGPSIGTIWFNNDQNSGTGPGGTMKLVAAIQAKAVTSDSNAGDDSGAYLQFLTKPESAALAESMVIHSDGEVTKPRQPSFRVGRNGNYNPGAGSDIIFNVDSGGGKHNVGLHYNTANGRFTAPVAGVYTFTAHVIWQGLSSGQNMADCFHPKINGTVVGYSGRRGEYIANETGNNGYYTDFMTYQFTLAAGDYITINNQFNLTVHGNSNYTTFSGHLVC